MKRYLAIAAVLLIPVGAVADTHYVPDDFSTIMTAMYSSSVKDGDTVVVRSGTYGENIDFLGKTITLKSEDGPMTTVIDGGMAGSVVTFQSGEGADSVLEGFTLTNGDHDWGGGVYCKNGSSPTIIQNIIALNKANWGGGLYCSHSTPIIARNRITDNTALSGGGIFCSISDAAIVNNILEGNGAAGGGGILCEMCSPLVVNCTLTNNVANGGLGGGGIKCIGSTLRIRNTILWNNKASVGPEIGLDTASQPVVTFCDVKGGWAGEGNIDKDPLFLDAPNQDYHLDWLSPCVNRGTNAGAPCDDMEGDPRPYVGTVDMGADEHTGLHALGADFFTLSQAAGGEVWFYLFGGAPKGGRSYHLLGSVSGTVPGLVLPGGFTLPLEWDLFTTIVFKLANTASFEAFKGNLTWGSSMAWARLDTLGPLPPASVGVTLHFAFLLYNPFDFTSNPVAVKIVP